MPDEPQRGITCWELLAQAWLLRAQGPERAGTRRGVSITQEADNATSVIVGNKLFSTSFPLARFILIFNRTRQLLDVEANINHVPGKDNPWADELSRFEGDLSSKGWDPAKEVRIPLKEVLFPSFGKVFPMGAWAQLPKHARHLVGELRMRSMY